MAKARPKASRNANWTRTAKAPQVLEGGLSTGPAKEPARCRRGRGQTAARRGRARQPNSWQPTSHPGRCLWPGQRPQPSELAGRPSLVLDMEDVIADPFELVVVGEVNHDPAAAILRLP